MNRKLKATAAAAAVGLAICVVAMVAFGDFASAALAGLTVSAIFLSWLVRDDEE